MGGRGAASGITSSVPNAERAIIADGKITQYLLDPAKKHYSEFTAVGYSKDNPNRLKQDLLDGLRKSPAKVYSANAHGSRAFEVDMMLGVTRKEKFRTGWQIDNGTDCPRFITAHRIGGKRK